MLDYFLLFWACLLELVTFSAAFYCFSFSGSSFLVKVVLEQGYGVYFYMS